MDKEIKREPADCADDCDTGMHKVMKLNEPEPEIDISEPIAITSSLNGRNEKIKLLVGLQELESQIKRTGARGQRNLRISIRSKPPRTSR